MSGKPEPAFAGLAQIENPELRAALESFGRTIAEQREKEREQPPLKGQSKKGVGIAPAPAQGQLILFPEWADTRRAAASAVFRSALFPALARRQRQYFERKKIFSTRGVEIFFTGKQFDQSDLDVYLEILHILKDQPSGTNCTFTAYGLLKAIGRSTGYKDHQWLHSVLIRLTACAVDMTDGTKRYFGSLLEGGVKDEITKHYTIRVNPEFAALFKRSWSSLDHEQRKQLRGNPTAQALHAYYSSHAAPGSHEFKTLAAIAGLANSAMRNSKKRIIKAHELMKETGFLKGYEITDGTIKAQVNHTLSQNRHIAGKIIKTHKKTAVKSTG
jgi:TrfA protein